VERLAGRDRYEGGAVVNQAIFRAASVVFLASGATFPDALSGGVSAGIGDNPLYVTTPECLSGDVWAEIGRLAPDTVTVLGGSAALGPKIDRLEPCSAD
jgi:putative cell wall-binding protein